MKKIFSFIMSLAMLATMGITPVLAQEVTPTLAQEVTEVSKFELTDMSLVETGTYRVTATDNEFGGFIVIEDTQGNLTDFVVTSESVYGYIFIDSAFNALSYSFNNVTFELVDTKDLGVSGKHIYSFADGRDYDPIVDGEYVPKVVDLDTYTDEQIRAEFS